MFILLIMAFLPTLEEVKEALRIDFDAQDKTLMTMLNACINDVERYTGLEPRRTVNNGILTIEDYSELVINGDEALLIQTLPSIPDSLKQAILDRVAFLYSNTGDLDNRRYDDWFNTLFSFSIRSII